MFDSWFKDEDYILISEMTWHFEKSQYDWTARNKDEQQEHDETVLDPNTKVVIEDMSVQSMTKERDYKIYIDDTFSIKDELEVNNPTDFRQTLSYEPDAVKGTYIVNHISYDGQTWRQTAEWEGYFEQEYMYQLGNEGRDSYRHPRKNECKFKQDLNLV